MALVSQSRITNMQRLKEVSSIRHSVHVEITDDYHLKLFDGTNREYIPTKTGLDFHQDNHFVRHVMGPYASGKSTICAMDIVFRAIKMKPCLDGIRRFKCAVIRNTAGELETSTYETWIKWFDKLGEVHRRKKPVLTLEHRFTDGNGLIEMVLVFLALDREDDIKKLKSTEFTMAYLNEVSELPETILLSGTIQGRVKRYPPKHLAGYDPDGCIIMDTNPPPTDHWLYKLFEEKLPDDFRIFKQPSGLLLNTDGSIFKDETDKYVTNPDADNLYHIAKNYYVSTASGATEEFIKVFCCGQYGILKTGKPVYPGYNDDLHACDDIEINEEETILMGWDFGLLTPALLVAQYYNNTLYVIKEFLGDGGGLRELIDGEVMPYLSSYLEDMDYESYHDPSDAGSATRAERNSDLLEEYGITSIPASTNLPALRIDSVSLLFNRLSNGRPCIQISKRGCPILRKGLIGQYQFKRVRVIGSEKYHDKPDKSHPISDIQDALQYICLHLSINKPVTQVDTSKFIDNHSFL